MTKTRDPLENVDDDNFHIEDPSKVEAIIISMWLAQGVPLRVLANIEKVVAHAMAMKKVMAEVGWEVDA